MPEAFFTFPTPAIKQYIDHINAYVISGGFKTKAIEVLLFLIRVNTLLCEGRHKGLSVVNKGMDGHIKMQ